MKKPKLILALCSLLSLGAASLHAVPYSDSDLLNVTLNPGEWIHSTFDIAVGDGDAGDLSGFAPGGGWITDAIATFSLLDLNLNPYNVVIDIGQYPFPLHTSFIDQEFVVSNVLTVRTLMDQDGFGIAGYSVVNTGTSPFTVKSATLNAYAVPDGASTVGLLGLSLIAVALVQRRSRQRHSV